MFVNLLIVQFSRRAQPDIANNIAVFGSRVNYVYIFAPLSFSRPPPRIISAIRGLRKHVTSRDFGMHRFRYDNYATTSEDGREGGARDRAKRLSWLTPPTRLIPPRHPVLRLSRYANAQTTPLPHRTRYSRERLRLATLTGRHTQPGLSFCALGLMRIRDRVMSHNSADGCLRPLTPRPLLPRPVRVTSSDTSIEFFAEDERDRLIKRFLPAPRKPVSADAGMPSDLARHERIITVIKPGVFYVSSHLSRDAKSRKRELTRPGYPQSWSAEFFAFLPRFFICIPPPVASPFRDSRRYLLTRIF